MKTELDALLCERYPLIFADRNRSIQESCMGRGIACGDGWFDLIDTLCDCLQKSTDSNGAPQVVAVQVKEKFGVLRFYVRPVASEYQRGIISMAEAMSAHLCEQCGKPGQVLIGGAHMSRCPEHAPEIAEKLNWKSLIEDGRA